MRYKQGRAYTPEAYKKDAEYFKDVAKAYGRELEVLYEAGLRNVQFDDPGLACELAMIRRDCPLELIGFGVRLLLQGLPKRLGGGQRQHWQR